MPLPSLFEKVECYLLGKAAAIGAGNLLFSVGIGCGSHEIPPKSIYWSDEALAKGWFHYQLIVLTRTCLLLLPNPA